MDRVLKIVLKYDIENVICNILRRNSTRKIKKWVPHKDEEVHYCP